MSRERDDALLSAWLDGELEPAEREALERRLEREPELVERLAEFRELDEALAEDPTPLPDGFLERAGARFRAEHAAAAPTPRRRAPWAWAGLAAAAILLAVIVLPREQELRDLSAPASAESESEIADRFAADDAPEPLVDSDPRAQAPAKLETVADLEETTDVEADRPARAEPPRSNQPAPAELQKQEEPSVDEGLSRVGEAKERDAPADLMRKKVAEPEPVAQSAPAPPPASKRQREAAEKAKVAAPGAVLRRVAGEDAAGARADEDRTSTESVPVTTGAMADSAAVAGRPLPGGDALAAERSWIVDDVQTLIELSGAEPQVAAELLAATGRVVLVRGAIAACEGNWREGTVVPTLVLTAGPTTRTCAFPIPPGEVAVEVLVEGSAPVD